jgi:hypothetical protein
MYLYSSVLAVAGFQISHQLSSISAAVNIVINQLNHFIMISSVAFLAIPALVFAAYPTVTLTYPQTGSISLAASATTTVTQGLTVTLYGIECSGPDCGEATSASFAAIGSDTFVWGYETLSGENTILYREACSWTTGSAACITTSAQISTANGISHAVGETTTTFASSDFTVIAVPITAGLTDLPSPAPTSTSSGSKSATSPGTSSAATTISTHNAAVRNCAGAIGLGAALIVAAL